jgi:hypothetical protein
VSPRELAWPGNNVIPGMAPLAVILARTEETAVAMTGIRADPAGFGFTLHLRLRNLHPRQRREFWPFPELGPHRGPEWPDEVLRLTIEFADGRSVSNLDPPTVGSGGPDPDRPMLSGGPGTGGGVDGWLFDMDYRVRPLPPPGPLAFVCVWPGRGISSSRVEVDGAAVREAADAAMSLWLDDPYCSDD